MLIDDETLIAYGNRDIRRATQWCCLGWACLLFGILFGNVTSERQWELLSVLCHCFAGAGLLFLIYTALMSLVGLLFSGRFSRFRFAGLLLLSLSPFLGYHLFIVVTQPT